MTAVILIAVGASFAFKTKSNFDWNATIWVGPPTTGWCTAVGSGNACATTFTGPQCTTFYNGADRLMFEFPIPEGPICVTPLRQYQP